MSDANIQPDMDWYLKISRDRGVSPRCPFATVETCPRYYGSLDMLGDAGCSTKISKEDKIRLDAYWEKSGLLPKTNEYREGFSKFGPGNYHFSNMCPEVLYDRFHIFASGCGDFADEIDRDCTHQKLEEAGAKRGDYRWRWSWIEPLHFSECHFYSPLLQRQKNSRFPNSTPGPFPGQK